MKKTTLFILPLLSWSLVHAAAQADLPQDHLSLEVELVKALEQNDYKEVTLLLEAGANPNHRLTINGPDFTIKDGSPLMLAALNNDFLSACELINHGANIMETAVYEKPDTKPQIITAFNCTQNGLIQRKMADALYPTKQKKESTLAENYFPKRAPKMSLEMDGEDDGTVRAESQKSSYLKSAITLLAPAALVGAAIWALLTKKIAVPNFLVGK